MTSTGKEDGRLSVALVAGPLPDEVMTDLRDAFDLSVRGPDDLHTLSPDGGFDALLVTVDVRLGADALAALPPSVGAIATYSVGLDHIDLKAAEARGLAVFNTPGVLADSVADTALFLLLAAARRGTESIDLIRSRTWPGWTARQLNGVELNGKRLGLYGMGAIGRRIGARARAFGMEIVYSDPYRLTADQEAALGAVYVADPVALLGEVDAVVLAAPATAETRGFLNAASLSRARPGLLVVNIGRGDLVDDDALIAALGSGVVRGAGLDVFNGEPRLDPRYFDLPNVFMTPHIGSSTVEARRRMGEALVSALAEWREGRRPPNQVC